MSKKLSKVLVVAVVLVLSMSLFALVACGGPEPLSGDTAVADLQANFNAAPTKTVKETVTLGGLDVTIAIINLKVKNVTAELTRTYKADGSMTLNAKISNVQVELGGLDSILGLPIDALKNLGLDAKVIENLKELVLEAEVVLKNPKKVNPDSIESYDNYLSLKKFELTGTEKVLNKDNQPWPLIQDLDLSSVLTKAENVNPRLVNDETGEPIGIFAAMDEYSKDKTAGTILENFIKDNYQMISAYKFGAVTVNKENFSSTAKADLSNVTDLGQKVLDQYKDAFLNGKDGTKVSDIITKLFSKNAKVTTILNSLTNLNQNESAVTMNGKMADVDGKWMISELHTSQKITVTISGKLLENVVALIGDLAPDAKGTLDLVMGLVGDVLKTGITGTIDAKVDANFTYAA